MELRRFLALLTIVLVIILAVVVWFLPPNEDFQTDNPFWNGSKDTISSLPAAPLQSLSDLPSLPQEARGKIGCLGWPLVLAVRSAAIFS